MFFAAIFSFAAVLAYFRIFKNKSPANFVGKLALVSQSQ